MPAFAPDKLDHAALDKLVTDLTVRAERLRVAFGKSRSPTIGAQFDRTRRQLRELRTIQQRRPGAVS